MIIIRKNVTLSINALSVNFIPENEVEQLVFIVVKSSRTEKPPFQSNVFFHHVFFVCLCFKGRTITGANPGGEDEE